MSEDLTSPVEAKTPSAPEMLARLRELENIPAEQLTDDQVREAVSLFALLRRTTVGPPDVKKPRGKTTKVTPVTFDQLDIPGN